MLRWVHELQRCVAHDDLHLVNIATATQIKNSSSDSTL